MRAEATLACTGVAPAVTCTANPAARAAALADINLVRTGSGGLAALLVDPGAGGTRSGDLLLDELLYNKRYSLMYENGDRWVDLRRYGMLTRLPRDRATDLVWPNLRLPDNECVPRTVKPAGCTAQPGVVPGVAPLAP